MPPVIRYHSISGGAGGVQGSVGGAGEVSGGQKPVLCAVLAGDAVSHSRYMRHRNRKSAKSKFL